MAEILDRPAATLAALFVTALAWHAVPTVTATAQAQVEVPIPSQPVEQGGPGMITDPNDYLKEQLILYVRPRLPEEQEFIDYVVLQVKLKNLPTKLVNSAMLYARVKRPYPFPYFKMAVLELAKREKIKLIAMPPSTTTPNSVQR